MRHNLRDLWDENFRLGYNDNKIGCNCGNLPKSLKKTYSHYGVKKYENKIFFKEDFIPIENDFMKLYDSSIEDLVNIEFDDIMCQYFDITKGANLAISVADIANIAYIMGQLKSIFEDDAYENSTIKKKYYENKLHDISIYFDSNICNANIIKKMWDIDVFGIVGPKYKGNGPDSDGCCVLM